MPPYGQKCNPRRKQARSFRSGLDVGASAGRRAVIWPGSSRRRHSYRQSVQGRMACVDRIFMQAHAMPRTLGHAAWLEPQQLECDLARWQSDGSGQGWSGSGPGTAKPPPSAWPAPTCLWRGPFSIRPGRPGNTPVAGCPPTVSATEGHGMILTGRRVDAEDATYRVARQAGPLTGSGP